MSVRRDHASFISIVHNTSEVLAQSVCREGGWGRGWGGERRAFWGKKNLWVALPSFPAVARPGSEGLALSLPLGSTLRPCLFLPV